MNVRLFLRVILALLVCSLAACSSFDRRWKEAATSSTAGRWDGRWTSGQHLKGNGQPEGGRLRAVTEPGDKGRLVAHFHANWIIFSTDYTMTFQPKPGPSRGGKREFAGSEKLFIGGAYKYEAVLQGDRLMAKYDSSYDRGMFDLHRVAPTKDRPH